MDNDEDKMMFDYADKFINLANEMSKSDRSGNVGVAIKYAAARYSAFEASMQQIIWLKTRTNNWRILQTFLQICCE